MPSSPTVLPVILAGGGGTRLWPMSRGHYPKQFLDVAGQGSLLQQTLLRVPGLAGSTVRGPLVVCNEEHRFLVAEQARVADAALSGLILEPVGRNTAPALCAAAERALSLDDDPILVMMPADHLVQDVTRFRAALEVAVDHAVHDKVATLGVVPTRAETGYGYIEAGPELAGGADDRPAAHVLGAFREKPDADTARQYLDSGRFSWNAGIFVLRAQRWLDLMQKFAPEIAASVARSVANGQDDGEFFRLDADAFAASPSDSIDYAVMEPLAEDNDAAVVVALDAGWSDVGSWSSLWQVSDKDSAGNVTRGDVCAIDAQDNLVFADYRLVATLGVNDLVVAETADAVLVTSKQHAEDVKGIVEWLSEAGRDERLTHRRVYRPWGSYEGIDAGERFQVKHITVNPGAALSLQMHHHRAEHWIVVSGTARVTRGDDTFLLSENESTYIPLGTTHRLENPGNLPLELIEVQSGSYLGEDDIVRFEDKYKRV